jgi:hypothetical protein
VQIVFGDEEVTSGAASDLQQVRGRVGAAVTKQR